ncbi:MAG: Crp/Fnr family transcriptional regulator [Solirubrobacterales bacterium]|nr:Crp/Fnr family transcriptional regulator [Solirubrobacterales bacterium]
MSAQRLEPIRLLDEDPDLGEGLEPAEFEQARRDLVVRMLRVPAGAWDPSTLWDQPNGMGLIVLDGLLLRDVDLGRRSSTEVLGSGDLLRPWDPNPPMDALPLKIRWSVLQDARLAVLDRRFTMSAARWPAILDEVTCRAMRRSRFLAVRLVVNQLVRLEDRLLLGLWALAERWGRVTPDGVLVPMELTHSALARLVGARRPSVTSALGVLSRDRLVERTEHGWLLRGTPSEVLDPVTERLNSAAGTAAATG